ncbi:hypothetical protein RhiLY_04454 [Ceratobasidium sp. AG-Ba]|nr:hypothetical protein RhiLY_04454 [Ceratobasidium sp. AG-Ba]
MDRSNSTASTSSAASSLSRASSQASTAGLTAYQARLLEGNSLSRAGSQNRGIFAASTTGPAAARRWTPSHRVSASVDRAVQDGILAATNRREKTRLLYNHRLDRHLQLTPRTPARSIIDPSPLTPNDATPRPPSRTVEDILSRHGLIKDDTGSSNASARSIRSFDSPSTPVAPSNAASHAVSRQIALYPTISQAPHFLTNSCLVLPSRGSFDSITASHRLPTHSPSPTPSSASADALERMRCRVVSRARPPRHYQPPSTDDEHFAAPRSNGISADRAQTLGSRRGRSQSVDVLAQAEAARNSFTPEPNTPSWIHSRGVYDERGVSVIPVKQPVVIPPSPTKHTFAPPPLDEPSHLGSREFGLNDDNGTRTNTSTLKRNKYGPVLTAGRRLGRHLPRIASGDGGAWDDKASAGKNQLARNASEKEKNGARSWRRKRKGPGGSAATSYASRTRQEDDLAFAMPPDFCIRCSPPSAAPVGAEDVLASWPFALYPRCHTVTKFSPGAAVGW